MSSTAETLSTPVIDLRSDTVTKPTAAMRAAMADAEVGDDVYGEDPTVNRLEARAAELFGREAAIFVPTGSMGNQIAIKLHTQPGQEIICDARGHIVDWEMAMVSAFSGCHLRTVPGDRGVLQWEQIKAAIAPKLYYRAQTGLISLENSHNMAGGTVTPLEVYEEIWNGARDAGIPVHLDGARVFNAATALGINVATLTSGFQSVMFCLSKGLCAPVGSILVGSRRFIERARSVRKMLGGGMRQAGILAAAGLIALEEMPQRLHEDHANARLLAEGLAAIPGIEIDLTAVQTNIVIFRLRGVADVAPVLAKLKQKGVLAGAAAADQIRFVTHHDISREACEHALAISIETFTAS
ncbi:threonine aldolase family protein [Silvibacterium dinghuense]|uniref:Aminotransferase class I/II-fold pyridoxal phosphate-dependent enzyme n=1 Tax=Silvibacterium dinghuense TaxID=1560006 RepID=A0A4Q1SG31_9BACT|nr:GntG family PLP-dependent aldolase [Silvibacterium dinghuense]RXS96508.1 aminotransferase class I/II-fold pyridoxal phosphate-dependent enzyme [Silvibacterium dinghuense]GGG91380.1 threonine aldolase [Silvibacterium dinghuense]